MLWNFRIIWQTLKRHFIVRFIFFTDLKEFLQRSQIQYAGIWWTRKTLEAPESSENVAAVVELKKQSVNLPTEFKGLQLTFVELECEESSSLYREDLEALKMCKESEIAEAKTEIKENTTRMFSMHSNLVFIDVSAFKSSGFGTSAARLEEQLTIVIYCRIKGHIPLGEQEFPRKLGKFKTDIRMGMLFSASLPTEHHDNLRAGCCISGIEPFCSTLGAFFKLPGNNKFHSWSCAHGFIPSDYLKTEKTFANLQQHLFNTPVYQPRRGQRGESDEFGKIVLAKIREGGQENGSIKSGVDGVIIQISNREPINGLFPDDQQNKIDVLGNILLGNFLLLLIEYYPL